MTEHIIIVVVVLFLASLVRTTFGFGDALIAMPLLAITTGVKTATPLVAFFAAIIAVTILIRDKQKIDYRSCIPLIIYTIAGIPLGLIFLYGVAENLVMIVLGLVLTGYSVYKLIKPEMAELKTNKAAPLFGIVSGILGGAYNTNGPPIIIYGTLKKWKPDEFRAMLQGIFLPTNIFIMCGQGIAGLWTMDVIKLFAMSLPAVIVAIVLGEKINKRIPTERFSKYIDILLLVLGLTLIIKVILK